MLKPICVPCQRFFRMSKSGFYFTEGCPVGPERPVPGTAEPEKWKPYKVWSGDRWHCDGCGATIISGTGSRPVTEHYMDEFEKVRTALNAAQFQVNDC